MAGEGGSGGVPVFNLVRLLDAMGTDYVSFWMLNGYREAFIRASHVEEVLRQDGWAKVYDSSEDPNWCCGGFNVVYANGNHEVELWCDEDGYVVTVTIRRRGRGNYKEAG